MVEPKRAQLKAAMCQLNEKQAALAEAQNKLKEVSNLQRGKNPLKMVIISQRTLEQACTSCRCLFKLVQP